jgi:hypothetical protein
MLTVRDTLNCGRIHDVIIYNLTKKSDLLENQQKYKQNMANIQVIELNTVQSFDIFDTLHNGKQYGVSLVLSKKEKNNQLLWDKILLNKKKIHTIFINQQDIPDNLSIYSEISANLYLTLSPKTKARDYESLFFRYTNLGIDGINFDIETVTKGQIALCSKFNLLHCAHSLAFDRHMEKANSLKLTAVFI